MFLQFCHKLSAEPEFPMQASRKWLSLDVIPAEHNQRSWILCHHKATKIALGCPILRSFGTAWVSQGDLPDPPTILSTLYKLPSSSPALLTQQIIGTSGDRKGKEGGSWKP